MRLEGARSHLFCGASVIVLCALLAGCVKGRVDVKVFKDGSGQIVVTQLYPRSMCEQYAALVQALARRTAGSKKDEAGKPGRDANASPFFNEKQIRKSAKAFGPSVQYAGARPIGAGGSRGYVALYHFKDVGDVHVDLEGMSRQMSETLRADSDEAEEDEDEGLRDRGSDAKGYGFRSELGSPARLTVTTPEPSADERDDDTGDGEVEEEVEVAMAASAEPVDRFDLMEPAVFYALSGGAIEYANLRAEYGDMDRQWDEYLRQIKGLEIRLTVEVDGSPVKCTATHRDAKAAGRMVLMDLNAAKRGKDPAEKRQLRRAAMSGDYFRFVSTLAGMPGACVETNREVVVEFN